MRLVTFDASGDGAVVRRLGGLVGSSNGEQVVDLQFAYRQFLISQKVDSHEAERLAAATLPSQMEDFIYGGGSPLALARQALEFAADASPKVLQGSDGRPAIFPLHQVRLRAPLTMPNSLRDFLAFEDHAKAGAGRRSEKVSEVWYRRPLYYKGNHRTLLGPDEPVKRPSFTNELDLELEVACVVGSGGRDLVETAAAEAIFGFTIMNDWSARDIQREEMAARLGPAKSKDFATSIGPCLVTADETGPQPELAIAARVNGKVLCEANLGDAYWSFPKMIAFVSQEEDVWPTDLYGSGTPFGGCLLDHGGPFLEPGDVVELEVEKIGILRNHII
jgi:2-keto-4-pentenoate hydratase/2-oxohepta-3-ene-1,7-dioic acid hydratase in catechol pathway